MSGVETAICPAVMLDVTLASQLIIKESFMCFHLPTGLETLQNYFNENSKEQNLPIYSYNRGDYIGILTVAVARSLAVAM